LTIFDVEKFTFMEGFGPRGRIAQTPRTPAGDTMGDITLDNRDTVAFEALTEGFARITAELTKKRDRMMNMRTPVADDRHPDARVVADRIDDGLRLLNPATDQLVGTPKL
jgi:hypothetical protein